MRAFVLTGKKNKNLFLLLINWRQRIQTPRRSVITRTIGPRPAESTIAPCHFSSIAHESASARPRQTYFIKLSIPNEP